MFESLLRRILYVWVYDVANIITSLKFLKKVKTTYGSNIIVLSDGAHYYKASCRILKLKHELYGLEVRNLMERIIQYIKDRTRLFDNYIPCMKNKCGNEHALMLMKSIAYILNKHG
ncbi:MAG: hypothetical protein QXP91_06700 [Candidatus Methanomethylicia archaeon]